jgi:glycosyltransferase involved in cell wall biosynthesis
MRLVVNAISAKVGGAVTYLQNVLPELRDQLGDESSEEMVVWRGPAVTGHRDWPAGIQYREDAAVSGRVTARANPIRRLYFDQVRLPKALRRDGADVLFSSANYGPLRCPCRQVLLVRDSSYFDQTYLARIKGRTARLYAMFQRRLTLRCMKTADIVMFPTGAMRDLLVPYFGGTQPNWCVAHYGTRHDLFYPAVERDARRESPVRLLHVSLYSDQKNVGTLLRAVARLRDVPSPGYRLRLTAGFEREEFSDHPATPSFRADRQLYRELHRNGVAEDLQWRQYGTLPELYRSADVFVFPSYTESFGHPLVEAMATGLPIVAADTPVNRELCGDAAVYCAPFDAEGWARAIRRVSEDGELGRELSARAIQRAKAHTWRTHVVQLMAAFKGACGD